MARLPAVAAAAVAAAVSLLAPAARAAPGPGEVLILEDNFTVFNFTLWKHEITLSGEGNWEFELYGNNRTNSYVRGGALHITPTLLNDTLGNAALGSADLNLWGGDPATACTDNGFFGCERTGGAGGNILNPVQSARIRTAETFAFRYGRVEVVAKLPAGDWLWPAVWLMPTSAAYGQWPASGEIDLLESRGNARGYPGGGCEHFGSTLHWGPFWPIDGYNSTTATYVLPSGTLADAFHTYGMVWSPAGIYTYIDDDSNRVLDVPFNASSSFWARGGWDANPALANPWRDSANPAAAPFDQRMYLLINVAVGGTNGYFPDGEGGKPWSNTSPNAADEFWAGVGQWLPTWTSGGADFTIDSVRVWQNPAWGGDYAFQLML
jgi:beta-glucanase (GH16 family)